MMQRVLLLQKKKYTCLATVSYLCVIAIVQMSYLQQRRIDSQWGDCKKGYPPQWGIQPEMERKDIHACLAHVELTQPPQERELQRKLRLYRQNVSQTGFGLSVC